MKKCMILWLVLGSSVLQAQAWQKDLDKAVRQAEHENKLVLLLFSVPENCDTCDKLEKNVFESAEFKSYANGNFVLAKPDFSGSASFQTKADNLLIVEKYNKDGFFPLVVILDKSSKVLGKAPIYDGQSPEKYIESLKAVAKR